MHCTKSSKLSGENSEKQQRKQEIDIEHHAGLAMLENSPASTKAYLIAPIWSPKLTQRAQDHKSDTTAPQQEPNALVSILHDERVLSLAIMTLLLLFCVEVTIIAFRGDFTVCQRSRLLIANLGLGIWVALQGVVGVLGGFWGGGGMDSWCLLQLLMIDSHPSEIIMEIIWTVGFGYRVELGGGDEELSVSGPREAQWGHFMAQRSFVLIVGGRTAEVNQIGINLCTMGPEFVHSVAQIGSEA
jgi:hypothetical protein